MTNIAPHGAPPYPDGPWTNEPDHVDFVHLGFACILHRGSMGSWCGYVAMPPGHPWHKEQYDQVPARVHGGLTYGRECMGDVCHVPKPGESDDVWWLGFDCSHGWDIVPAMAQINADIGFSFILKDAIYRDQKYAMNECKRLAAQAKKAGKSNE